MYTEYIQECRRRDGTAFTSALRTLHLKVSESINQYIHTETNTDTIQSTEPR